MRAYNTMFPPDPREVLSGEARQEMGEVREEV